MVSLKATSSHGYFLTSSHFREGLKRKLFRRGVEIDLSGMLLCPWTYLLRMPHAKNGGGER